MSKGRKKASIRDLSRIDQFDPHVQDMLHELDHQTDRGAALVAASMVQVALMRLMRCRIVQFKDSQEILFEKEGAPLSTFSDCIKVARAFGVIGQILEGHLNAIRSIRNQFAHSPLKIDFANELIAKEVDKLLPHDPNLKPQFSEQRSRYVGTCIAIVQSLEEATMAHTPDTITVWTG